MTVVAQRRSFKVYSQSSQLSRFAHVMISVSTSIGQFRGTVDCAAGRIMGSEIEEYAVDNICVLRHDTSRDLDGGVR